MSHVLVIDQGTTSTRSIVFDAAAQPVATAQREFPQSFPRPGWVEHDPEDLWRTALDTAREAMASAGLRAADVAAVGIANQRETCLLWDRATGRAVHPAIVWQDRRTAGACEALAGAGHGALVTGRTGLRLDPYFTATKLAWMLDQVPGAREAAEAGRLAFGTVDTFLLWRLTGGRVHATDATNASRTLLLDIHAGRWDPELLQVFRVPAAVLPEVRDSAGRFGATEPGLFGGAVEVRGIAGDQQAALIGQACLMPGMIKSTYGTGCFALLNTGSDAVDALPAAELPVGASREVQVQGRTLMMHRVDETTVTAFTNVCTHQGCLLQVVDRQEGPAYACPCHGSHFDVTSGKPFGGPARKALMDYDAAVVDDRIVVKL